MTAIEGSIISALEQQCKIPRGRISKETLISDLPIDSLMFMNVIVDIETILKTSLNDEAIIRILTVENIGELCDLFSGAVAAGG